jgi:hypothetical protein
VRGWILFYSNSPNFVNDRILNVWARVPGHVFIFEPWIMGSIKKCMDLIHHAAEGMPANPALHSFTIERCHVAYAMSEETFPLLLDDFNLDAIESFHFLTLYPVLSTSERVYENCIGSI